MSSLPRITGQRFSQVASKVVPLGGGLNLIDPRTMGPAGMLAGALNFEGGLRGGYRRIDGFERYDGREKPSNASYWLINFDAGTGAAITAGQLLGDSGSPTIQGEALVDATKTSGTWGVDAAGYVPVVQVTGMSDPGNFSNNDALYVGAGQVATVNGAVQVRGASTDASDLTLIKDAIETLRTDIGAITGSGAMRGVWVYNNNVYAFRDDAGGTECKMWVASTSGWTAVNLGGSLAFTNGNTEVSVGDTITGDSSNEDAEVTRVVVTSGAWGGTAAGTIWYKSKSGAFQSGETFDTSNFTMTGSETDTTLSPGGTFRFDNANFTGHESTEKMYGCDGVNAAFEFDGSAFLPIATGMATDTPTHIQEYKNYLFLAFSGGSLQNSSLADPFTWSPVTGSGEIGTGDEITGLLRLPDATMLVADRNRTYILSGTPGSDLVLKEFTDSSGVIANTLQRMWTPMYLDDRGLTALVMSDVYGDFEDATFSQFIRPLMEEKKKNAVSSVICREKNQYRIFFSDSTALYCSFDNRQITAIMPVNLGKVVRCIVSAEDANGDEVIFFGSDDGYIYELDKGTSLDGSALESFIRPVWNSYESPHIIKRYRWISFDIEYDLSGNWTGSNSRTGEPHAIKFKSSYDYDSSEYEPGVQDTIDTIAETVGRWDVDNWDEVYWGSPGQALERIEINGKGVALGFTLYASSTYADPFIVHAYTVDFSGYRRRR